jgi:hypothetical protein
VVWMGPPKPLPILAPKADVRAERACDRLAVKVFRGRFCLSTAGSARGKAGCAALAFGCALEGVMRIFGKMKRKAAFRFGA